MFSVVSSGHGRSSCSLRLRWSMYCRGRGFEPLTCYMLNDIAVFCRLFCWGCLKMWLFREVEVVVETGRSSCRRWERPPVKIKRDIAYGNCEAPIV